MSSTPRIMGILNVTPDSFYAASRTTSLSALANKVAQMMAEGADMLDIGACSTRPGAEMVDAEEEFRRLEKAVAVVREVAPDVVLSVDTFRAEVARRCVEHLGANIINDVSGGSLDEQMFSTVAQLRVPYVLTHMRGTPATMQQHTHYGGGVVHDVIDDLTRKLALLREKGCAEVIIDPGFGFVSKTIEQNYEMLASLDSFKHLGCPVLVGVSRKSMVYKLLGITPEEALNGTTVLHTIALQKGVDILRVHDVKEAVQVRKIWQAVECHEPQHKE